MKIIGLILLSILVVIASAIMVKASSNNRDRYNFYWDGFEKDIKEKRDV